MSGHTERSEVSCMCGAPGIHLTENEELDIVDLFVVFLHPNPINSALFIMDFFAPPASS